MTMALFQNKLKPKPLIANSSARFLKEKLKQIMGLVSLFVGACVFLIIWSYDPTDPSFRSATHTSAKNLFGSFGSFVADPLHLAIGMTSYSLSLIGFIWGLRLLFGSGRKHSMRRITVTPLAIAIASMFLSAHPIYIEWPYGYGLGGVFGDNGLSLILNMKPMEINNWLKLVTKIHHN